MLIEVKSGKDYERHNALSNVMENEEYAVPMAYVFCLENIQIKGRVIYYPIYMITFFEQIQAEEKVYKFESVQHQEWYIELERLLGRIKELEVEKRQHLSSFVHGF